MSGSTRKRVEELFHQSLGLPERERAALLERECAGDERLFERVSRLLRHADSDRTGAMDRPVFSIPGSDHVLPGNVPERVGRYRVVRLIGEGGMGAVYEAQQESPQRTVALKVIRTGLATRGVLKRFQQECQVLGRLSHPGIAQIYEAGVVDRLGRLVDPATPSDEHEHRQPFLAMELVHGVPLDRYADAKNLGTRERLNLVASVADAVAHAHQHGVIHRDLKPGNVLVDEVNGVPRPRVLDFGVAHVADAEALTATLRTGVGELIGTLAYMSPEQATGDTGALDARADVYSLGVLAFELLAGRLPLDLSRRAIPEAARVIREEEPSRLGSINTVFRGDVETIVAKALEKDPARRYQSAGELAEDIRRFLHDEPIVARPAGTLYQLGKFARRNRTLVAGVLATFLTLLAGAVTTAYWAVRATERRQLAEERADLLQRKAYRASIAAAQAAVERGQADAARLHLADAPGELRGWEWNYLQCMLDRSDRTLDLPAMGYTYAALDGEWAFLQGSTKSAFMNWMTGHSIEADSAGWDSTFALSVSPRGDRFAICGTTGAALHDAATGKLIRMLPRGLRFETQAFSRDGSILVGAAVQPREVLIVDAGTGEVLRTLALEGGTGRAFPAMSPVEDTLAVELDDDVSGIMELGTGRARLRFPGSQPRFSSDGTLLMSYAGLRTALTRLEVRESATGALVGSLPLYEQFVSGDGGGARQAVLSPDGSTIAVLGANRAITIYETKSMRPIGGLAGLPLGQVLPFAGVSFSTDGHWLAGVPGCNTVKVWNLERGLAPIHQPRLAALSYTGADISPDGRFTATGDWGQVTKWSVSTGAPEWSIVPSFEFVTALAFSPDGGRLCVGGDRGTLRLLDAADGRVLASASPHGVAAFGDGWVSALDWCGDQPVAGFADGTLMLLDAATLQGVRTKRLQGARVNRVSAAPDGAAIAAIMHGTPERLVLLAGTSWDDVVTRELPDARSLAWNAKGSRLAVGRDQGVSVFDAQGHEVQAMEGARSWQTSVAFSPDEKRVVGGSWVGGITIWHADAGDLAIDLLMARVDASAATAFTPDGATIVSVTRASPVVRLDTRKPGEEEAEARAIVRRAADAHERALVEEKFARETIQRLERAPGLDERVRAEAIRRARVLGDQVGSINNQAFMSARLANDATTLRQALRESEAVIERCQDGFGLLTRGMVLYRAGRYEEALGFFARAELDLRATRANWGEGIPELSCFRGLTEAALGHHGEAEKWFSVFERVTREPRYRDSPELPSYREEVRQARGAREIR